MSEFTVKAVINRQKNKVLFAEIENDLANVLVGFMTLTFGRVVRLLRNHFREQTPVIGSFNTLYDGIANLDSSHFKSCRKKKMLLDLDSDDLSLYDCHFGKAFKGNFFEYAASFIVSDNLRMIPNVNQCSFVDSLDYVRVAMADMDGAETRILTFGLNEIMELLKRLFISCHPLTDVILGTKWMDSTAPRHRPNSGVSLHDLIENYPTPHGSKEDILLYLTFEKSTNKLLFAQADQDFVDILFSMLKIPLGAVMNSFPFGNSLDNIHNLHESISEMPLELFNDSDKRRLAISVF